MTGDWNEEIDFNQFDKGFTIVLVAKDHADPNKEVQIGLSIGYPTGHGLTALRAVIEFAHREIHDLLPELAAENDASLIHAKEEQMRRRMN